MRMRAALLEDFGKPLVVTEVDLDEPRKGEVLVRLAACGVSDIDVYAACGADPLCHPPAVLGHEGAGVVVAVGPDVVSVSPGDHVVTLFCARCRECADCRSGRTNICIRDRVELGRGYMPDGTPRLSLDGEPIRHFRGTSAFAEYAVMSETSLAKIPPEAPLDGACLFAGGLSTGLGAAIYGAQVEPGSTCAVFGAGLVGLGAVVGCLLRGADRIIAVDLLEERLAMARYHGATETLLGGADAVERIRELTDGWGADYTFDATGLPQVMREALDAARPEWGVCTITGVAGSADRIDFAPSALVTGRSLRGGAFGGVKGRDQVPELVQRYLSGNIDANVCISRRIALDDVNRAFELIRARDGIRSVIVFA